MARGTTRPKQLPCGGITSCGVFLFATAGTFRHVGPVGYHAISSQDTPVSLRASHVAGQRDRLTPQKLPGNANRRHTHTRMPTSQHRPTRKQATIHAVQLHSHSSGTLPESPCQSRLQIAHETAPSVPKKQHRGMRTREHTLRMTNDGRRNSSTRKPHSQTRKRHMHEATCHKRRPVPPAEQDHTTPANCSSCVGVSRLIPGMSP
jgi:ribosomal protein L35